MSNLSAIRTGFKTVVEAAIPTLQVYPYQTDGVKEYPCLQVHVTEEIDYQTGAIGTNDARFELLADLLIQIHDSAAGWKEMDEYRSPTGTKSIRAAVETDRTLNSSCTDAEVVFSSEATRDRDGQDGFWEFACQFRIQIIANIS